jgi:predicted NAD/FAD-dependent oxidoreductase
MAPARVAVVGAGMAGLVCARALVRGGCRVTLIDKGRGPGGRLSTRRIDGLAFDHGAQDFAARDAGFAQALQEWRAAGVVSRFAGRVVAIDEGGRVGPAEARERWVPVPSTSALARHLAAGLSVETGRRIVAVHRRVAGWHLVDESGAVGDGSGPFDLVLLAVPAAQAVPLLPAVPELAARAAAARFEPCWAVGVAPQRPLPLPYDAAVVRGSPLAWICRGTAKPGRAGAETWMLHASPAWSEEHLEDAPEAVVAGLSRAFVEVTGHPLEAPLAAFAHRWRFARVARPVGEPCLFDAALGLGAAGDWCLGPRLEAAFLSGSALAERVLAESSARAAG